MHDLSVMTCNVSESYCSPSRGACGADSQPTSFRLLPSASHTLRSPLIIVIWTSKRHHQIELGRNRKGSLTFRGNRSPKGLRTFYDEKWVEVECAPHMLCLLASCVRRFSLVSRWDVERAHAREIAASFTQAAYEDPQELAQSVLRYPCLSRTGYGSDGG